MKRAISLDDLIKIADRVDYGLYGDKINETLFKHLSEEIEELKMELAGDVCAEPEIRFKQLKELGDVLFCIISIARTNELDINQALSLTITKLQERIKFNIRE